MSDANEQFHRQALAAQKFTRKYFVVELDFGLPSIDELERQFVTVGYALRGGLTAENVAQLTDLWGAYVGEVIRRQTDAAWIDSGEDGLRRWRLDRGAESAWPHEAIHDRLTRGPEANLRTYFDATVTRLKA